MAQNNTVFKDKKDLYDRPIINKSSTNKEIGIDLDRAVLNAIADGAQSSSINISQLNSFSKITTDRNTVYDTIDTMCEDPTVAAAIEIYAEDVTQTNEQGRILWATAESDDVRNYVEFLLSTINAEKYIYKWTHSLIKYGDLYLKLYHESDYNDGLLDSAEDKDKTTLNEDVVIRAYSKKDKFAHYLEMIPNPAEMFELTKFGKVYAYIQAKSVASLIKQSSALGTDTNLLTQRYSFNRRDVYIYEPTNFVHAALEDDVSRFPEQVDIFLKDNMQSDDATSTTYTVRRGQSLLFNTYKIWRQMSLLELSLLLNRITRSSSVKIVNVEVGDMDKQDVATKLLSIKQLFEQKASIDVNNSMSEYNNPAPMENTVYAPTRNGVGAISVQEVSTNPDVKGLADIDYFKTKFYNALRIPKQYLGDTEDSTGFNGGTSLSIISSRYAKTIKRIQNTLVQAITDAINIMLIDKGLDSYVDKFTLHMQEPTTQEELDRRDAQAVELQGVDSIMSLLNDVEEPSARLQILKSLLSDTINNQDVLDILSKQIEDAQNEPIDEGAEDDEGRDVNLNFPSQLGGSRGSSDLGFDTTSAPHTNSSDSEPTNIESDTDTSNELPSPADLNAGDFTDNNLEV